MADIFTAQRRSEIMSRVRSARNKTTELRIIALFKANRITGWRRGRRLFGKPDFVFQKHRAILFVDGCFWHGCPQHSTIPEANRPFWQKKLLRNKLRDQQVARTLREKGWRVIRIWEHDLKRHNQTSCIKRITAALKIRPLSDYTRRSPHS